ncbi:MAG: SbcC/MukB-like Walker B domain-containing protein [Lysobacteraceae bacterium]
MYQLKRAHLVQFFLFQAETLELDATTAIIAPNGAGKSALLDALQIVMLGADRNQIRFNAQAGGSHRARSIRDYCLGVYRAGDDGRVRETATTYISLVFEDTVSGEILSAGVALGASADEPDHRVHGMYLLPRVALTLDDHLETVKGQQLPLTWIQFRTAITARCKSAGTKAELHATSDRFLRDLLLQLRPASNVHIDPAAYRKAFQNALNLQRVNDVDLFVRTLVAEERPTDIGKFRALLEGFRLIKEKIEQVARRIDAAEIVEGLYRKVAAQATRSASYRALGAEYRRDGHSEQVDAAEDALTQVRDAHLRSARALEQARSDRATARQQAEDAQRRLQGTRGYSEQASFDQIAGRDRDELTQLKRELMRNTGSVRDQLATVSKLDLPGLDTATLTRAAAPWGVLFRQISELPTDADIDLPPDALHAELLSAMSLATPTMAMIATRAHELRSELDAARRRADSARQNQKRLNAGKAELRPDVIRLMSYFEEEGIPTRPVCDLVQVADPTWQGAIEAYLRSHVEALLVPAEHEERAVKLYRSLHGGRAVYGVKIALASQARQSRADVRIGDGQVSALLRGDDDALAYLRRQLGELRCIETEAEVVRAKQGMSRDGLVVKGGGVERLRLPAASELKIGASDNRERLKLLRDEIERADQDIRRLEAVWQTLDARVAEWTRIGSPEHAANAIHALLLKHRESAARYRALCDSRAAQTDPDLIQLSEHAQACLQRRDALEVLVETLVGEEAVIQGKATAAQLLLDQLNAESERIARAAVDAFRHPDVDPNLVEQHRDELDAKYPELGDRIARCLHRADDAEKALNAVLPEAWSGLAQYAKDHGIALDVEPQEWRKADALLRGEIAYLKGTELVQHQAMADEAYATAVETFRSNVASALYDNFTRLKHQIQILNRTLMSSPAFSNNERYKFHYEIAPEFKDLYRFIERVSDVGETDTLFGSAGEVPEAFRDIIEEKIGGRGNAPSPLDDYRRFFAFEVNIQQDGRVIGNLSERMRSGSGGEHRAPMYVIAGAALAAAYGKRDGQQGGLGLIMLDEFGDKIDAQNARATTQYLRSLGLQLILAAPDTAQGTLTGVLDSYIELFRDGPLLQVERVQVTDAGRALLHSDQFALHPELLAAEIARIEAERVS